MAKGLLGQPSYDSYEEVSYHDQGRSCCCGGNNSNGILEALALLGLLAALGIITLPGRRRRRKRSFDQPGWFDLVYDAVLSGRSCK